MNHQKKTSRKSRLKIIYHFLKRWIELAGLNSKVLAPLTTLENDDDKSQKNGSEKSLKIRGLPIFSQIRPTQKLTPTLINELTLNARSKCCLEKINKNFFLNSFEKQKLR